VSLDLIAEYLVRKRNNILLSGHIIQKEFNERNVCVLIASHPCLNILIPRRYDGDIIVNVCMPLRNVPLLL